MKSSYFPSYTAYVETGIRWLDKLPQQWDLKRLKEIADIKNSNVDKNSYEHEIPVLLCNYVDVYKNEFIDSSLNFMQATADESEIKKFTLTKGNVLITKDSETFEDIAVPALVTEQLEGVICGYHLAHIKSRNKTLLGSYLFRLFQSTQYNFRFAIHAKGFTRFGLGQSAVNDALTPIPPLEEQQAIADYLDAKTKQIDRKIVLLEAKAEKYAELKQSLINETVTRGLDKSVPMKASGLKWVDQIPAHWEIKRAKDLFKKMSRNASENEGIITAFRDGQVTLRENRRTSGFTNAIFEHGYQGIRTGDLVIHAMDGFAGAIGVSDSNGKSSPVYSAYTPADPQRVHNPYYGLLVREMALSGFVSSLGKGIRERSSEFRHKEFAPLELPVPPFEEQKAIADYLEAKTAHIEKILETIHLEIEKFKELRKTLINDVVTGKIKVYQA